MEHKKKQSGQSMQRMRGKAAMSVVFQEGATVLKYLYQDGSAKLRFPQTDRQNFEGIMINTAGGITGGDYLEWDVHLFPGTNATLTTQAAEKVYRAIDNIPARVDVRLVIDKKSRFCWLPQETILFDRSCLKRSMTIFMEDDAELLLSEIVVFGRKMMGERLKEAFFQDNWIVRCNDKIIHAEAFRIGPDIHRDLAMPVCLNDGGAMANLLLIAPDNKRLLEQARSIIGPFGGVSSWNGKLLARMICRDLYSLRKQLIALINLLNNNVGVPGIWFM